MRSRAETSSRQKLVILREALSFEYAGSESGWYSTEPGSVTHRLCLELTESGLMEQDDERPDEAESGKFRVTPNGIWLAMRPVSADIHDKSADIIERATTFADVLEISGDQPSSDLIHAMIREIVGLRANIVPAGSVAAAIEWIKSAKNEVLHPLSVESGEFANVRSLSDIANGLGSSSVGVLKGLGDGA